MPGTIMWFRRDLRMSDNEALAAAFASGSDVFAVAFARETLPGPTASERWRAASLAKLRSRLAEHGHRLTISSDDPLEALPAFARDVGASSVHCTRDWSPHAMAEEEAVAEALRATSARLCVFEGQLLVPPDSLRNRSGGPYRVFTPFHRAWNSAVRLTDPPAEQPSSEPVPRSPGSVASPGDWTPGEAGAMSRLSLFTQERVHRYAAERDFPAAAATSELSPHLSFGEVSPRQVLWAVREVDEAVAEPFVRQLAWREFAYHVLHHFPHAATRPLRPEFEAFPWRDDEESFRAWVEGRTGYPLVDAGMRQLAATGWMHNRIRLVCGSFLTKDLLVPWQRGAAYFESALVDFDPGVNAFNWQWVAGSGADASPYFRIFNPDTQQRRFDPDGEYVARWAPDAGHEEPIVRHDEARLRALDAYEQVKRR